VGRGEGASGIGDRGRDLFYRCGGAGEERVRVTRNGKILRRSGNRVRFPKPKERTRRMRGVGGGPTVTDASCWLAGASEEKGARSGLPLATSHAGP